ncbi:MAG: uncharacterized protein QOF16_608 [Actinomycetota bacterium]|jgi:uncharacterized membrane protein YraQ (UPF0718 family)|nr:uncharacterized protein [Actinomycetota bacterium]
MAGSEALVRPTTAPWRNGVVALLVVGTIGLALAAASIERVAAIQNFILVFGSLLVEAIPFILVGAAVSALIEVFVPISAFERLSHLPRPLQLPAAAVAGFAFPVCDCGSVPVARRLASKGLAPGAAITFMLAAPILNPLVIASTIVAYRGRDVLWQMVIGRMVLGLITAIVVGWVIGERTKEELLRPRPSDALVHSHEHDSRMTEFFGHLAADFIFMGRYLVLGAAVAGALQTFLPQSILSSVAGVPILDVVVMMALAAMLSICSESDAFVAASFVQFGFAAQLAFLCFGPMVDMKLGFLYSGTFGTRFFRTVAIVVAAVTLTGTLWVQMIVK